MSLLDALHTCPARPPASPDRYAACAATRGPLGGRKAKHSRTPIAHCSSLGAALPEFGQNLLSGYADAMDGPYQPDPGRQHEDIQQCNENPRDHFCERHPRSFLSVADRQSDGCRALTPPGPPNATFGSCGPGHAQLVSQAFTKHIQALHTSQASPSLHRTVMPQSQRRRHIPDGRECSRTLIGRCYPPVVESGMGERASGRSVSCSRRILGPTSVCSTIARYMTRPVSADCGESHLKLPVTRI